MEPAVQLAACPDHPERAAVGACSRCGRFVCEACAATLEPARCRSCQALADDPMGVLAEPFSFAGALRNASRLFRAALLPILGVSLVFSIPGGLLSHALADVRSGLRIEMLFEATVGLMGTLCCLSAMASAASGRRRSFGSALADGFLAWSRVFGPSFMASLKVFAWALLLIVPGIIKWVRLALVVPAAYFSERDSHAASTRLVEGRSWPVFATLLVAGALWFAAIVPASVALELLLEEVPSAGLGMGIAIAEDWLYRVAETFVTATGLAIWYGLRRSRAIEQGE